MKTFTAILLLLLALVTARPADAQTTVIPVLGVGELVIEVPTTPTAASAQTYNVYVDANKFSFTVTCTAKDTTTAQCPVPLSALNLTTTHRISVSASVNAADGVLEGAKIPLPFDLARALPPVDPQATASVRPVPQD